MAHAFTRPTVRQVNWVDKVRAWDRAALKHDRDNGTLSKRPDPQTFLSAHELPVLPRRSIGDVDFFQSIASWRNGTMADDVLYHTLREVEVPQFRVVPANPIRHIKDPLSISFRDPVFLSRFQDHRGTTLNYIQSGVPTLHLRKIHTSIRTAHNLGVLNKNHNVFFNMHERIRHRRALVAKYRVGAMSRTHREHVLEFQNMARTLQNLRERNAAYRQANRAMFSEKNAGAFNVAQFAEQFLGEGMVPDDVVLQAAAPIPTTKVRASRAELRDALARHRHEITSTSPYGRHVAPRAVPLSLFSSLPTVFPFFPVRPARY